MVDILIFSYANKTLPVSNSTDRNFLLTEVEASNLFNNFELDYLRKNDLTQFVKLYQEPQWYDFKQTAIDIVKEKGTITSLDLKNELRDKKNCWVSQKSCAYNLEKVAKKQAWLKEKHKKDDYSFYKDPNHISHTLGILVL
jgi:hypothetical protein